MPSATGTIQYASKLVKLNRLLILAAILLVCCSCINSKATGVHGLSENQSPDSDYPSLMVDDDDDSIFVERASPRLGRGSPRLGRGSPRLGRGSPRLGRRAAAILLSRLNHPGRYYDADDDDETVDHQYASKSLTDEKRAPPRLGRAIKANEQ